MTAGRRTQLASSSGFSLLEVLVASAVLAIVLAVLLGTLTTSLSLWRNTEGKLYSDREARAAELLIAQDLASVVMPATPGLWPRVSGGTFQFLVTKPEDYQGEGEAGDVCFVEYSVNPEKNTLTRIFYPSSRTFDEIIRRGSFPSPSPGEGQILAANVLADNRDAVRGLAVQREANPVNFVMLGTNTGSLVEFSGSYSPANRPVAVEVNFAVTDPSSMQNRDLWEGRPDVKLRNAGLYSFRAMLPQPASVP
jgi:prepilin-type N-terminal cleavage/methylation domain-containing protein